MEYLSLSRRHIACLALIASGKDARESAAILGLPLCEIEESLEEARLRLGAPSVQCAARVVQALGWGEAQCEAATEPPGS
jgi:hypothetical protein